MTAYTFLKNILKKKTLCDANCWYYGSFGGEEGCDVKNSGWGGWPEQIEPGQKCLYPKERNICEPLILSLQGVCAALEGVVVIGGSYDNTSLTKILSKRPEMSG